MRRALMTLAVMVLVAGAGAVRADSLPLAGGVQAFELCTQDLCGKAFFAGLFKGRIGNVPTATGLITVAANHEPLPAPGKHAALAGRWQLLAGFRLLGGSAAGDLLALDDKRFIVTVHMVIEQGGSGDAAFTGLLDHNYFPPHLDGVISQ